MDAKNPRKKIEVHPFADLFPMLPDDELAELADDIRSNGLQQAITLDAKGVLIDGRNRLKACEIADVEPFFETFDGDDDAVIAFILSLNVMRRHLWKGQKAMAVAFAYPEASKLKRRSVKITDLDTAPLSHARTVLAADEDLAKLVLSGEIPLKDAYSEVTSRTGTRANVLIRTRRLRESRSDLAERVGKGELSLDDAERQAKVEADEIKQRRWAATVNLIDGMRLLERPSDQAREILAEFDPAVAESRGETITPERLRAVAAFAAALADAMEDKS